MGFWISIFIALAVLGSVLWLQPSPRDRFLTKIRNAALSKGLKIRVLDEKLSSQLFPWIKDYRIYVLYEKPLPNHAKPKSHKASVIRLSHNPEAHELDEEDPLKIALFEKIGEPSLPSSVEAFVISVSGISVVWREFQNEQYNALQQLDMIENFLEKCAENYELWT